jgi:hypothetical protein
MTERKMATNFPENYEIQQTISPRSSKNFKHSELIHIPLHTHTHTHTHTQNTTHMPRHTILRLLENLKSSKNIKDREKRRSITSRKINIRMHQMFWIRK